MEIKRINSYSDERFSQKVLYQHGCFWADGEPYEVEIISEYEAVVRGKDPSVYPAVIEQFLFFTPHITSFYDEVHEIIKEYPREELLKLSLEEIQPSQFYFFGWTYQIILCCHERFQDCPGSAGRNGRLHF